MATVGEASSDTQLASGLKAGLDTLSLDQSITFTQYVRVVLPIDGFVFWVKAELLSPRYALFNKSPFDTAQLNQAQHVTIPAKQITVKGSLHFATENRQEVDETIGVNSVIFSAQDLVHDFNAINSDLTYLATINGPNEQPIRVAFSRRDPFFQQAGIYHYRGEAVFPAMLSQIIDDPRQFNRKAVLSNSMTIWIALNQLMPVYPAHLIPMNIAPPYASAEIRSTNAIQASPNIDQAGSHTQLVRDQVKIVIYGIRNDTALDYQDYIFDYSLNSDTIGIMNMPVIADEKRIQSELNIIAIKKSIEFDVNYYQSRMQQISRQVILSAIPSFTVN